MNVDGEFKTYTLPAQPLDSPRFELISKELAAALDKPGSKGRLTISHGELELTGDIETHAH